jgi:tetratricopeptide (TPR) repeat protein
MTGRGTLRLAAALATAALGASLYWSLRLAYADLLSARGDRQSVERAVHLAPASSGYHARLSLLLDAEGGRAASTAALQDALAASPLEAAPWIALGLRRETAGDFAGAERCLLEAARLDRTYDPRWALANYYFRRGNWDRFWLWVRRAAEMAPPDMRGLFRLCWNAPDGPVATLARAIPDRPEVRREYLAYLVQEGAGPQLASLAAKMAARPQPDDLPVLLDACDRLLATGDAAGALPIWNGLSARRLIPSGTLSPQQGRSLSNGGLESPRTSRGFDWRLAAVEGVSISRTIADPSLRVAFSGRQPERCEVLWQYLPLVPSTRYRLEFECRASGIQAGAGLRWRIASALQGGGTWAESADLGGENWSPGDLSFQTPSQPALARLVLLYERRPGTTRIQGAIWLRRLKLGFAP